MNMDKKMITLQIGRDIQVTNCVVLIPEIAIIEGGYIRTYSLLSGGQAKHEYHAMTQMTYFQYQDDEIEVIEIDEVVIIHAGEDEEKMGGGAVIYKDLMGGIHILVHKQLNIKKLLEAAYRYTTRWVRLDI